MADYDSNNLKGVQVGSLKTINTTLNVEAKKTINKPVFSNKATSQRDVTIDLTQFLETENNKYIVNDNKNNE